MSTPAMYQTLTHVTQQLELEQAQAYVVEHVRVVAMPKPPVRQVGKLFCACAGRIS